MSSTQSSKAPLQKDGKPQYRHGFMPTLKEYWTAMRGFRYLLPVMVVGMVADGILQSSVVAYVKIVIDKLVADPKAFVGGDLGHYVMLGLLGGAVFFPFAYTGHLASQLMTNKLSQRFRLNLYSHLQKLNGDFYQKNQVGEISSRLTGDIESGVGQMSGFLISNTWAFSLLATSLVSMYLLDAKLFLVFVALNLSYTFISRFFSQRIRVLSREVRDRTGELNARVTEDVSANVLVRSFAVEDFFFGRFRQTQEELYRTQVRSSNISIIYQDLLQVFFHFVAPVAIIGTGALLVGKGLTVGSLVAFWAYWKMVQGPMSWLFNSVTAFYGAMAAMDRVMEFFVEHPLVKDKPKAPALHLARGEIVFDHLSFAYPSAPQKKVLDDLAFTIPARSSLGIVGPSGAGKSTLIQLLLRFYDPTAGRILVDGEDISQVRQVSLRKNIGVVMQDTVLLSGTVRENLLLGRENASDKQLWEALEHAGARQFVEELSQKLDARLGERGLTLSGGQRQRLAIARVFIKDPPIVIFDEATSALDTLTEMKIQDSIQTLLKGRTSIVVAHRLSTVMRCDRILLVEKAGKVQLGSHQELLQASPLYHSLVSNQTLALA